MTEQSRHAELAHEGAPELFKSVRQNDDLSLFPEGIEEIQGPRKGLQGRNDSFDGTHGQSVLVQDRQTLTHQEVIIWLIPGGTSEFRYSRRLSHGNPNFGDQNPLKIEGNDGLMSLLGDGHVLFSQNCHKNSEMALSRCVRQQTQ